jgi:hypothetical protein
VPRDRLGPSAAPRAWIGFVLSDACSTAAPSRIGIAASTPSWTSRLPDRLDLRGRARPRRAASRPADRVLNRCALGARAREHDALGRDGAPRQGYGRGTSSTRDPCARSWVDAASCSQKARLARPLRSHERLAGGSSARHNRPEGRARRARAGGPAHARGSTSPNPGAGVEQYLSATQSRSSRNGPRRPRSVSGSTLAITPPTVEARGKSSTPVRVAGISATGRLRK